MKQEVKQGQTDYTVFILVRDTSGNAKTGLAFGDIDLAYGRVETDNDVTTTDVAPADLATPLLTDPHLDWGFLEVSAGDHPGLYRLDLADEVFASGAWSSVVTLTGAGLEPSHIEFMLIPESPYSANGTSLTEAGGDGDHLTAINLPNQTMDITGNLSGSVGSVTGHTNQTADNNTILAHADYGLAKLVRSTTPANKLDVSATGEAGLDFDNIKDASGAKTLTNITVPITTNAGTVTGNVDGSVGSVTGAVGSVTGHTPQTADHTAILTAIAGYLDTEIAAILADTDELQTDWTNGGRLDLLIDAIKVGADRLTDARATELDVGTTGKLAYSARKIMDAVVNKLIIKEAANGDPAGTAEMFNDADVSLGTVSAAFTTDGTYTTRKRMVI